VVSAESEFEQWIYDDEAFDVEQQGVQGEAHLRIRARIAEYRNSVLDEAYAAAATKPSFTRGPGVPDEDWETMSAAYENGVANAIWWIKELKSEVP
jgi:hypothetical protein